MLGPRLPRMQRHPKGLFAARQSSASRSTAASSSSAATSPPADHRNDPSDPTRALESSPASNRRQPSLSTGGEPSTPLAAPAARRQDRSKSDVEDWEDVKDLFSAAVESYEAERPDKAVELFRQVVHESNHLLRLYPDPFLLLSNGKELGSYKWTSPSNASSSHARTPLQDGDPLRSTDRLTTFHYVYGTSMLLLGKILEAYPALAKDDEPANTPAFYLAALDVFEDGDNAIQSVSSHKLFKEDWRLGISVGRTLICLADEKLKRLAQASATAPSINFQDDLWPKDSGFGPSFSQTKPGRPPLTRRVTLPSMTPNEILLQAADQFTRAVLHMPHRQPHDKQQISKTGSAINTMDASNLASPDSLCDNIDSPPSMPGLATKSRRTLDQVRPRVLYTIGHEVLSIADRMPSTSERESWAKWADDIFMQMETEEKSRDDWVHHIAVGRGRCWLIVGATRFEGFEGQLETGGLTAAGNDKIEEARQALLKAVQHLEKAKAVAASLAGLAMQDPFGGDVSPMLGEAFITLAALTPPSPARDKYFARAAAEGVRVEDEEGMEE